jgi:hypothetical protein
MSRFSAMWGAKSGLLRIFSRAAWLSIGFWLCSEQERLFQNFSFGTATLNLREKSGYLTAFSQDLVSKPTGFWNKLKNKRKSRKRKVDRRRFFPYTWIACL